MMTFLKVAVKLLIIVFLAVLPLLPLAAEYIGFRRDKQKGISHKRFRLLVFMVLYVIAVTLFLYIVKEFLLAKENITKSSFRRRVQRTACWSAPAGSIPVPKARSSPHDNYPM